MRRGSLAVWSSGIVVAALSCGGGGDDKVEPAGAGAPNDAGGQGAAEQGGAAEPSAGQLSGGGASAGTTSGEIAGEGGLVGEAGAKASSLTCGDGVLDAQERCDDANATVGDGCSKTCRIEPGWTCDEGEPTHCTPICGDGLTVGPESTADGCDDGHTKAGDGCSDTCEVEPGFACDGEPSVCGKTCGNDDCSVHATCSDAPGGFTCECKAGYTGDGVTCAPRSCAALIAGCGASTNDDCCAAPSVPGGGFTMGASTVGKVASFELDKYEVTVGRFRAYVNGYAGPPAKDAGAHPLIAGSGWQTAWNSAMPADKAALTAAVQCDAEFQTWNANGTNDFLPMNCVNWYEAFAFCAWDGGRLPTELESQYAYRGGSDNRIYPWGDTPVPSGKKDATETYAVYDCLASGSAGCAFQDILRVGSRAAGASKFGQVDLAGSIWEWNLDWHDTLPATCENCANVASGTARVEHGGCWNSSANSLTSTYRVADDPTTRGVTQGFRCAR
ncbi:MAG: SUMF1/EgtB/PvdO family nonheme iron enzyme [Myxococcales bacterium]